MDVAKTGSVVVMLASHHKGSQKAALGTLAIAMAITFWTSVTCLGGSSGML